MGRARPEPRAWALALAVGLVLADSSVVVLALPEIGVELPLVELYEGIAFETDEDSETA